MCLIVQPIAARSEYRFVAQCEHGTVFVHWQISCWTLSMNDFNNLIGFLETSKTNLETEVKDGAHALKRAHSGVQLWIGIAALGFSHPDWQEFLDLIFEATPRINEFLIVPKRRNSSLVFN